MSVPSEPTTERRDFLAGAARWTTAGAIALAAVGISRMPKAAVLPGPSSQVKIGPPEVYPVSNEPVRVPGFNLFVLHDADGFSVISAICSHLGCIVASTPEGFECPCHGSRFSPDGRVTQGPAPSPLTWYEVGQGPDGTLVVDTRKTVAVGTRFQIA